MDIVYIRELNIETTIGIYDWEKVIKQTVSLDIDMDFDISSAVHSDNINDTLNYKSVAKRIVEFVETNKFELIERFAHEICKIILFEFKVEKVKLRMSKPGAVTGSKDVGVIITRTKDNY